MDLSKIDRQENLERMRKGELYYAFTPDLVTARYKCNDACQKFNNAGDIPRRRRVELWKEIVQDTRHTPGLAETAEADEELLSKEPWILPPIMIDYGTNFHVGEGVFLNYNTTVVDTCSITIGARTLVGPNCSFYSGTHPLDPAVRNGTNGPELGKPIVIGEDCWLGGNVIILPGVTLGRGVTVGAGSVVTKDIPAFHVAAGNPAKVLRKIQSSWNDGDTKGEGRCEDIQQGAEAPMREL